MHSFDFCHKGPEGRDLWGTLSFPLESSGPMIVMAHGSLGFKDWAFFPWLADFFAQAGFPVIRFNFSGSGMGAKKGGPFTEFEAFKNDTISRQVEDLRWVIQAATQGRLAKELPPQDKILLWGHSRGGAVCLLAAGRLPAVRAAATWATIARVNRYLYDVKRAWREEGFYTQESSRTGQPMKYSTAFLDDVEKWGREGDLPTYVHNLNIPLLLVHGSEDTSVSPEESESLAAVHPQSRLLILAGANHKFNSSHPFTSPPPVLLEAAEGTVRFYRDIL
jgi:pimeloyl-ACP methyl ester carboxylesterase